MQAKKDSGNRRPTGKSKVSFACTIPTVFLYVQNVLGIFAMCHVFVAVDIS